jgi:uncharacterized protein
MVIEKNLKIRYQDLKKLLGDLEKVIVAFSGGVDSSFLLKTAVDVLGVENVIAVTVSSDIIPSEETILAGQFADEIGVKHKIVEIPHLEDEVFSHNPEDRCYICKRWIMDELVKVKQERDIEHILDGTNYGDLEKHRPGLRALREYGVVSPLAEVGLTDAEIRELSRELGLPFWNKPATTCLMTRFPYDFKVTKELLERIHKGEEYLRKLGFEVVRLRYQRDGLVSIEVPVEDIPDIVDAGLKKDIVLKLKSLGFRYITLDLEGYRSGSMDMINDES